MDFSSHNPLTSNALNLAARNNDIENVRRLLKKINPNCVDNRGWTCLHEAANSDSYESLSLILKHPGCRHSAKTHEGHTALYLAIRNKCSIKTIQLLLTTDRNIVNESSTEGVTPLHIASGQGRVEVMQILLDHGASIDAKDFDGDTPLHEACLGRQHEAVLMLLQAGANPCLKNEQYFTPLHIACAGGSFKAVNYLLQYTNDINQRNASGDTPLMVALQRHNDELIYFLLDNGADPNLKNFDDKLALDIALDIGYSSIFKKLLSVTDENNINLNIITRACKPHYFTFEILNALLSSNMGPKFFEFTEPCDITAESVCEFVPCYKIQSPLNSYLNICEYMHKMVPDKFKEFFDLFLMRGVSVNASEANQLPPLVYLHYCAHGSCFEDVVQILTEHGCDVDYCSISGKQNIPDAFLASVTLDPITVPHMIPYSLVCDPGFILKFALDNGILNRMPLQIQNRLMSMIDNNYGHTITDYILFHTRAPTLKHLCRLKLREIIKFKDGKPKTTQDYLSILSELPLPSILKKYLRFM